MPPPEEVAPPHVAHGAPESTSLEKRAAPPLSLRWRISPQAIEDLITRYTAGEKAQALSQEFGISESGLRDLEQVKGVTLRGHAITSEDAEKTVHLWWWRTSVTRTARSGRRS